MAWLVSLALLLASSAAAAQEPVQVGDAMGSQSIGRHLSFLLDPTGRMSVHDARAAAARGRFVPSEREYNGFGYEDAVVWIRFETQSPSPDRVRWLLDMGYELHDRVDLYVVEPGGAIQHALAGDQVPFATWPVAHRRVVLPVDQPTGLSELFVRVYSTNPMNLPLQIHSPKAFAEHKEHEAIWLWLFYGLVGALTIYNAFLFLFLRDRSYLYYVLYIVTGGLFVLSHNGLAYQYLWPNSPTWNNQAHIVFAVASSLAVLQFCRSFLNTPRTAPRIDRAFVGLQLFAAGMLLPSVLVYAPVVGQIGAVVLIFAMWLMLGTGIMLLRRGFRPARFYILSWAALLIGVSVSLLKALGVLPIHFLTNWGYQLAVAVELILLSVALADRINQMKRDVERLNVALGDQVLQRTRSLRTATLNLTQRTAELERINDQLRTEIEERQRAEAERNTIEEQLR
ncbi:MAG: hypothetical protein JRI23_32885, partial [Deltaproteobacteria bacterium]|nr:hypothetical protein [Deltaproteobacteria bacterium]